MFAYVAELPGTVAEVAETRPTPFTNWYDCADFVEVGWNFNGSTFSPPVAAPAPAPTAQQVLQYTAQMALDKSDVTIIRCYAADPQVAVPAAWTTYRSALRAIANGTDTTSTSLPSIPAYPTGT